MKPKLLIRLASGVIFLHVLGHCMGAFTWKQAPNAAVGQVIVGMEREHFEFMGRPVTLANFFDGYGFINIFVLLLISTLLWLMASEGNGKVLWPITFFLAIQAVLEWIYFFPLPAIMSFAAAILCALALRKMQSYRLKIQ